MTSTIHTEVIIRQSLAGDIESILRIAAGSNLSYWSAVDYTNELAKQETIFYSAHRQNSIIGFIMARLITQLSDEQSNCRTDSAAQINKIDENESGEVEIFNIAVDKACRNRGIGKLLINRLCNGLTNLPKTIVWLEVRSSNRRAIDFYCSQQFTEIYKRKNYYRLPTEDALVLRRELIYGV